MSVFNFKEFNGQIVDNNWVEWRHAAIPNKPEAERWVMRILAMLFYHCLNCTALSGCYFPIFNIPGDLKMLHLYCDCSLKNITINKVKSDVMAVCPLEKFTKYIFADKYADNGKRDLFYMMGFNILDSYELKLEYEKQAKQKYIEGDFRLVKLDKFGQNINITINLKNKKGREVEFISGWKVFPEGLLNCNTPLGDR